MAHFRRRRPAHRTGCKRYNKWEARKLEERLGSWYWMSSWPAWWDVLYHRRPHRRRTKATEHDIVRGADPDALLWPLSKRPHSYYW